MRKLNKIFMLIFILTLNINASDDIEDQTQNDSTIELEWQNIDEAINDETKYTYHEAITHCSSLLSNNKTDWRLPTIDELRNAFQLTDNPVYTLKPYLENHLGQIKGSLWSISENLTNTTNAYMIYGNEQTRWSNGDKNNSNYALCVRNQSVNSKMKRMSSSYIQINSANTTYVGNATDQTYSLKLSSLPTSGVITIIDKSGNNTIDLEDEIIVTSFKIASNELQLTINGSSVNIRNADTFTYKINGVNHSFLEFVKNILNFNVPSGSIINTIDDQNIKQFQPMLLEENLTDYEISTHDLVSKELNLKTERISGYGSA